MARCVAGHRPGSEYVWTPEVLDNGSDPDPIRFTILAPTEAEKRELTFLRTRVAGRVADAPTNEVLEECARRFVRKVTDNYEVRGVKIVDGETLAKHGEQEFLLETYLHVLTGLRLDADQKKESGGSCACTGSGTHRCSETADRAIDPDEVVIPEPSGTEASD